MAWLSFRGISTQTLGLIVINMPAHVKPERRTTRYTITGQDGELHVSDGAYNSIKLSASICLNGKLTTQAFDDWMDGKGDLILSDDETKCYKANVIDAIQYTRDRLPSGKVMDVAVVQFTCQPHRYQAIETALALTATTTITNVGNCESMPMIVVHGSGDGTLSIGSSVLTFTGLSGDTTIDSAAGIVYNSSGSVGGQMVGDFPSLQTGDTVVSFTGGISSVTIRPRWRWK